MSDIKHQISIAAPAEKIFVLIHSGGAFNQWWAEDVFDDAGDAVSLGFFGRTTIYRLRREESVPNVEVVWQCESGNEWEGTHLNFVLAPAGASISLKFIHAGWREETPYFRSCNTTWGELMFRLKAAAEGNGRGPLFRAKDLAY